MTASLLAIGQLADTKQRNTLSRLLSAFCGGIARYFDHRAAIARLRELDDARLQDIGLQRSQIEAAVRGQILRSGPGEDSMTTSPAVTRRRADRLRRAPKAELASWN
jgi:uncharacterized protein YjiS (DUF1127 family)